MKKYICFILIIFPSYYNTIDAQNCFESDSLRSEFKYLVKLIEATHPDPYTDFGGKIAFHQKAHTIGEQLKEKEFSKNEYSTILSSFLSNLHDGHTFIFSDKEDNQVTQKYIPLELKILSDGMLIEGIPSGYAKYLGSRIVAINDIPLDSLCKHASYFFPSENIYGEYVALKKALSKPSIIKRLFPEDNNQILVSVIAQNDQKQTFTLNTTDKEEWYNSDASLSPRWNNTHANEYLYYKYLDNNNRTMFLNINTLVSKECFLFMYQNKWPSFAGLLEGFYKQILKKEMPTNTDKAIQDLPSYAKIFKEMLLTMKKNNSSNLIIDLRNNEGGWTPITLPTLYMLYGDEYLNTNFDIQFYQMLSPLLLKKRAITLEEYNKGRKANYQFGDYIFPSSTKDNRNQEQKRTDFVNKAMGNADIYIKDLDGKPVYSPSNVYVLIDAKTFSAAFHYAFYLWKMGATIVGVPSSQAPNTFMELTEFELPYTKIKGSISNSAQYFLPPNNKRAKIFYPDLTLNYTDYKKFNFDQDTELLWLLDYIKNKE